MRQFKSNGKTLYHLSHYNIMLLLLQIKLLWIWLRCIIWRTNSRRAPHIPPVRVRHGARIASYLLPISCDMCQCDELLNSGIIVYPSTKLIIIQCWPSQLGTTPMIEIIIAWAVLLSIECCLGYVRVSRCSQSLCAWCIRYIHDTWSVYEEHHLQHMEVMPAWVSPHRVPVKERN